MRIEPGDFGPEFVTAAAVQGWLDRLGRKARAQSRSETLSTSPRSAPSPTPSARESGRVRVANPRPEAGARAPRIIPKASIFATVVLALAVWAASGFYRVQPDQVGLVLRYGELVQTTGPGLNYHWPYPIEFVMLPRVTAINQLKIGGGSVMQMLTGDENIVEATASISWRIRDPAKFLFNVYDPEGAVKLAGESAVQADHRPQSHSIRPLGSAPEDRRRRANSAATHTQFLRFRDSDHAGAVAAGRSAARRD